MQVKIKESFIKVKNIVKFFQGNNRINIVLFFDNIKVATLLPLISVLLEDNINLKLIEMIILVREKSRTKVQ